MTSISKRSSSVDRYATEPVAHAAAAEHEQVLRLAC